MPIFNGFAVLEWMRGNMPEVRAAVYSSSELEEDREKAKRWSVAYLPKSEAVSVTEYVRNWEADSGDDVRWDLMRILTPSSAPLQLGYAPQFTP